MAEGLTEHRDKSSDLELVERDDAPTGVTGAAGATSEVSEPGRESPGRVKGVLSRLRSPRSAPIPREIEDIVRLVRAQHPKADTRAMVRAFELATGAHQGQLRKSGDRFIEHPIGVARIVAEQGMDTTSVMAAFLHDAVEDTDLSVETVAESLGAEVADIIEGLTKIERIGFRTREQERAENLRKMIVAMAKDLRVLVVKLADRLHNMRTLGPLDPSKRELVAAETLEIYAPLAHRLGMQEIRAELEDLAFKHLHPKVYAEIEQMVAQRQPERDVYLSEVIGKVRDKLRELRVKAEVYGRHKHYYSIWEKMAARGREFDEIYDLVGVRIIVESAKDCWAVLGAVHALWKPVPGRFKDYIANPKFNVYQSLHTNVVGPGGKPLEIQIRTQDMHRVAEKGVAAHWYYKEGFGPKDREEQAAWMRRMVELEQTEDDSEFLHSLRLDLFADEVFVFTPKGDVVELPLGATPLDFAYAIHTEVGHSCVGARVNSRMVPLDYRLSSGETVEVITSKSSTGPSRDWLKVVTTPRARTKIKQWFSMQRRGEAVGEGKEALARGIRRAGLPIQKLSSDGAIEAVADELKFPGVEAMNLSIGEGRTSVQSVVARLARMYAPPEEEEEEEVPPVSVIRTKSPLTQGVIVKGLDDIWVKLARCCMPVPPDAIIGFITRGRGISVHRRDCPNSKKLVEERERLVEVAWDPKAAGMFPVSVQVEALDRAKLLSDVATAISDFGVSISAANANAEDGLAKLRFTFELPDPSQLAKILATIRRVEAVYDAYRVTPLGRGS